MKSALSLTLAVALMTSVPPVMAQEPMVPAPGPIAKALTREAIRLAAANLNGVRTGGSADVDWMGVRRLAPGTEIIVTVGNAKPRKRYFVLAVGSTVTVLNLTAEALPAAATRLLRDIAAHHPEYFASTQRAAQFGDQDVQVRPDGVFLAGHKIADLDQIVERIARADVVDVRSVQPWSHARTLAPGTEIIVVTGQGSSTGNRYVVLADDSNLTVLNLTDPALPVEVTRVLRDAASEHPEGLASPLMGGTFISKNVRVVPGGVFVADRKVIDLGRVLQAIPRTAIEGGAASLAATDEARVKGLLPTGAKIGIGAGVGALVVFLWIAQHAGR
jgi:hypothetical protein